MKRTLAATILFALGLLAASASEAEKFPTRDQLNDAGRGIWADDTADVLKPRQLLYETKDDGRYRVGYNLIRQSDGDVKGYFLRLTIKNLSDDAVEATADVTLIDQEPVRRCRRGHGRRYADRRGKFGHPRDRPRYLPWTCHHARRHQDSDIPCQGNHAFIVERRGL